MQTLDRNRKILLGLNLVLGVVQIIGMFTDFEFESPYLNLFFPVFVTSLALVTIWTFSKSKLNHKQFINLFCIPSLAAGLPYFLLFLLLLCGGWYAAGIWANNFNARSVLNEIPSPDGGKIAIIYYNPPIEGGNIGIEIKLKYKYVPIVVRSVHEEWIDFDWDAPRNSDFKYNLDWIDNENIQVGENHKRLNVSKVKLVMPKIIAGFFPAYK